MGALGACSNDELADVSPDGLHPIVFAPSLAEEQAMTRAGSTTLAHNFTVYGYKNVSGSEQQVFDGYTVKYLGASAHTSSDNTDDYYYVTPDQPIRYWDFDASEYHFWGMWGEPADRLNYDEAQRTLTIKDVPLRIGEPNPADDVLFTYLTVRHPISDEAVHLSFCRPYAKVRIQFYSEAPIQSEQDNISVSNISLKADPDAEPPLVNTVYGKGDVLISYPLPTDNCGGKAREDISVRNLSDPTEALLFESVTLTPTSGANLSTAVTAPVDESIGFELGDMEGVTQIAHATRAGELPGKKYYYYPLPMGKRNPDFHLTIRLNGDSELKTVIVPAAFMQWQPNRLYTYIFKISGLEKKVEFCDVQVDPWLYGDDQDEEWTNWW